LGFGFAGRERHLVDPSTRDPETREPLKPSKPFFAGKVRQKSFLVGKNKNIVGTMGNQHFVLA
jgi:hypothetical protein